MPMTQIYLPFRPRFTGSYDVSKNRLESCISDVRIWMANNFLKLNDSKSEFLILRPSHQSAHLSNVPTPLAIGRCQVSTAVSARNFGVIFDETMSLDRLFRLLFMLWSHLNWILLTLYSGLQAVKL